MKPTNSRLLLPVTCITAVVALSTAAILVRWSQAPAITIAMYRLVFSAPVLLGLALRSGSNKTDVPNQKYVQASNIPRGDFSLDIGIDISLGTSLGIRLRDILGMLLSGVFLAAHFGMWIASLNYSSVAISVLLVSLHPLIVVGVGRLLGEQAPRGFGLALAMVLPGTVLIALGGQFGSTAVFSSAQGVALALGGAVMMSGYLLVGRRLRRRLANTVYAGGTYSFGAAALIAVALISGTPILGYPAQEYLLFAALALIPTLLGHTLLNWALRHVPTAGISLLYLGEPVGAALLAAILFGEIPGPVVVAGGGLVLGGLFFLSRRQ